MAQPCAVQNEQKIEQLKELAKRFEGEEWKRYLALCKLDEVMPRNALTDIAIYEEVEQIEAEHVFNVIKNCQKELYLKAKNEDPEKRAARRGRIEGQFSDVTCGNCGSNKIMYINAYSRGNNIWLPSGIRLNDSCFPAIPHLCYYKSINMNLCLDCGCLVGFDKKKFDDAVLLAEYLGDID